MKTLEQIAADCGMPPKVEAILKRAMNDERFPHTEMEDDLCEIIGDLYRRIEKLEEEKAVLVDALVVVRDADCDEDGMNGEYALPLDIERRVEGALRFAGVPDKEDPDEQLPESIGDDGSIAIQNPKENFDHDARFDEGGEFHEEANPKEEK